MVGGDPVPGEGVDEQPVSRFHLVCGSDKHIEADRMKIRKSCQTNNPTLLFYQCHSKKNLLL